MLELYCQRGSVTTQMPIAASRTSRMATNTDKVQFRGEAEKETSHAVKDLRLGGISHNELARRVLQKKLREVLSDEEQTTLHQRYKGESCPKRSRRFFSETPSGR